jgi:hypothetical protein
MDLLKRSLVLLLVQDIQIERQQHDVDAAKASHIHRGSLSQSKNSSSTLPHNPKIAGRMRARSGQPG